MTSTVCTGGSICSSTTTTWTCRQVSCRSWFRPKSWDSAYLKSYFIRKRKASQAFHLQFILSSTALCRANQDITEKANKTLHRSILFFSQKSLRRCCPSSGHRAPHEHSEAARILPEEEDWIRDARVGSSAGTSKKNLIIVIHSYTSVLWASWFF